MPDAAAASRRFRPLCRDNLPVFNHHVDRCFVGNLGNEVDDNSLIRAFQSYPSFQRAKVIFDKRLRKTRGYGFVSFRNAECFSKALREMQVLVLSAFPCPPHSRRHSGQVHRQPPHHYSQE